MINLIDGLEMIDLIDQGVYISPEMVNTAAVVFGASILVLILWVVLFVVKALIGHVVAGWVARKARQRWGRQPRRDWREEDEI